MMETTVLARANQQASRQAHSLNSQISPVTTARRLQAGTTTMMKTQSSTHIHITRHNWRVKFRGLKVNNKHDIEGAYQSD